MAETNSFLEKKLEQAVIIYLSQQAELTEVTFYEGQSNQDKSSSCVKCEASQGEEFPAYTGNYWVDLKVTVFSPAAEDTGGHQNLTGNVRAYLQIPNFEDQLNGQIDLFGASAFQFMGIENDFSGDQYESTYKLRVLCCESNL